MKQQLRPDRRTDHRIRAGWPRESAWYEPKLVGWPAAAAPAAYVAITVALVLTGGTAGPGPRQHLVGALELVLPLGAALAATWAAVDDPATELRLSLPLPYRTIVAGRALVGIVPSVPVALAAATLMSRDGLLPTAGGWLAAQLVWSAPMLWLAALGVLVAVASRSAPAGTAVVAIAWLVALIKHDTLLETPALRPLSLFTTTFAPAAPYWLTNRVWLLATAAALGTAGSVLLRRPERLLGGEH